MFLCELILICTILVWFYGKKSDYDTGLAERQATLLELNAKLDDVKSQGVVSNPDVEMVQVSLSSAKKAGDDIASNQNELLCLFYEKHETREQEDAAYEKMRNLKKESEVYFGEGSDFCNPWFYGDTESVTDAKWSFQTNYNYAGDVIPVLWVLSSKSENDLIGSIVSYVTADYHASSNTFDHVLKHVTRVGNSLYAFTNDQELDLNQNDNLEDDVNSILSLTDIDRHVTEEQHQKEEDFLNNQEDFRETQAQARDQMMAEQNAGN